MSKLDLSKRMTWGKLDSLCISLSTLLQLGALLSNSKVNFIAYYLVDKKHHNDPTLPFEYMFYYLIACFLVSVTETIIG